MSSQSAVEFSRKLRSLLEINKPVDHSTAEILIDVIGTKNQVVRELALKLLGRSKHPRAFDILTNQLNDKYRHFRAAAAYGLGELGVQEAVPYLEKLQNDPALAVRQEAAAALGKLGARSD